MVLLCCLMGSSLAGLMRAVELTFAICFVFCLDELVEKTSARELKICGHAPQVPNAVFSPKPETDDYSDGDFVQFECKEGYEHQRFATTTLQCRGGRWEKVSVWDLIHCTQKCSVPPTILNAHLSQVSQSEGYREGDVVKYACQQGYMSKPYTSAYLECNSGEWERTSSWDMLTCIPSTRKASFIGWRTGFAAWKWKKKCYDPPSRSDLRFVDSVKQEGYRDGEFVRYVCKEGYTREYGTHSFLECRDGDWVNPSDQEWIICNEKCFSVPPKVENAHLTRSVQPEGYIDGDHIKYECNEGYVRQQYTSSFLGCRNGIWQRISDWDGIRCLRVTCLSLHRDPNGYYEPIRGGGFRYGSVYRIKCKPGFKFNDSDPSEDFQIKCNSSGQWSVEQPLCKEYKKGKPTARSGFTARPPVAKEHYPIQWRYLVISLLIPLGAGLTIVNHFVCRRRSDGRDVNSYVYGLANLINGHVHTGVSGEIHPSLEPVFRNKWGSR